MHHDTPLISTIVAGLVLAFVFGMIANRFRLPPLVGYLFAGILVGPHTPGFVADQALGAELAELGVILLMFGVGLHFSLKDLMSVRALAIPGAVVQIAFATLLGAGLGLLLGWNLPASLLFGLALSVASTVVLLKALQDRRLIETEKGRVAVGWLIVEDLAMVLALVLIPAFASLGGGEAVHDPFVSFVERVLRTDVGIWGILGLTIVKVAAFVGFMLVVGRRIIPWALHYTAHTGSRELFRLAVLAIALGVALGSAVLFGVSLALGAFFAGMILSESELSQRAANETLPLRDAFAVLFFVSVGMLFDPGILISDPLPVLATVFIIVIGKSLAAFGIVLLFRRPISTALTISASLAQIGEFSFILASLGISLAIFPPEGQDLILAGALISIVLNPLVFWGVDLARPYLETRAAQRRAAREEREGVRIEPTDGVEASSGPITTDAPSEAGVDRGAPGADDDTPEPTTQTGHTILVGFGRVGSVVGEGLHLSGAPLVVIEDSDHAVATARGQGIEVVVGNAASTQVMHLANIAAAKCLMIAIPNGFEAGTVCETGRKLNPAIRIIARAHSTEEEAHLRGLGANTVIMGEREIGLGMLAWLRGDRADDAGAVAPVEPRLPPLENILEKVAASPDATSAGMAGVAPLAATTDAVTGIVAEPDGVTAARSGDSAVAAAGDAPVPVTPAEIKPEPTAPDAASVAQAPPSTPEEPLREPEDAPAPIEAQLVPIVPVGDDDVSGPAQDEEPPEVPAAQPPVETGAEPDAEAQEIVPPSHPGPAATVGETLPDDETAPGTEDAFPEAPAEPELVTLTTGDGTVVPLAPEPEPSDAAEAVEDLASAQGRSDDEGDEEGVALPEDLPDDNPDGEPDSPRKPDGEAAPVLPEPKG